MTAPDLDRLRGAVQQWLTQRLAGEAAEVVVPPMGVPTGGGSSETYLLTPTLRSAGSDRREQWILRIEPRYRRIYRDASVERQYRALVALSRYTDVPVPRPIWYEPDGSVLGAPFFVMERVEGAIPPAFYHSTGLFAETTPDQRESMWLSAIETMARIHIVDTTNFGFLDRPERGPTGVDQELATWDEYRRWSGISEPIYDRVRLWLSDNMPEQRCTGLAWGDARPANMIFRDLRCCSVIDWETISLGGAESDLGWWLVNDWLVTECIEIPRLRGVGSRTELVQAWEHFAGRRAVALEWHEVFAMWRFCLISARAWLLAGGVAPTAFGTDIATRRLDRLAKLVAG